MRQISERVAMGRALWRELVIGFASQLGELRLGFTQLAALYVLADGKTTTVADLADALGRSPSATSRLVDGLVRRRLVERRLETEDRRQRTLWLTQRGQALLRVVGTGPDRDGRRGAGDACHLPPRPVDSRVEGVTLRASESTARGATMRRPSR